MRSPGLKSALGVTAVCASGTAALAQVYGQPVPWQMGMQEQVTDLGRFTHWFHDYMTAGMALITLFVAGLLLYCIFRFGERANPVPSKTTHNTAIEVAWTIVPVLILVAIAIPSFRILREQLVIPPHDVVVKATGHAWYWSYEYPADQGGFRFEANMLQPNELKPGQPYQLAVDNEMVVPVGKVVRMQVTAADVLHSWAMPAFGFKLDAVPGRLNEMWFKADREGVYYGQCSELCGNGHPFMPIAVRVVSETDYAAWIAEAKTKFARIDGAAPVKLAAKS